MHIDSNDCSSHPEQTGAEQRRRPNAPRPPQPSYVVRDRGSSYVHNYSALFGGIHTSAASVYIACARRAILRDLSVGRICTTLGMLAGKKRVVYLSGTTRSTSSHRDAFAKTWRGL